MVLPRQILLLSDNAQSVASLEGALSAGQFRLHRLMPLDQLEQRLPALMTTVDGAIVDGTAPYFSNGRLDPALLALDRCQLGAVLLTPAGTPPRELANLPLVWPVPAGRADLLAQALHIVAGYQQVIRQFQREIRLFQRLDNRLTGQFTEIDEEMRLASRIQRDFLPRRLPSLGPASFATLYRPAGWVSGDLYDVFRLDESHVGFYVADAVGHGMPAALLTMFIKRSMETKQVGGGGYRLLGPEETMAALNRALVDASLSASQFTTALYAVLNIQTLQLEFARGGHPHPLWLHADGATSEPETDGSLLGVFTEAEFRRGVIQMSPGDKLILYSDGLEMVFVEGDQACSELYRRHIEDTRHLPIEQMLATLVDQMDHQIGSLNPRDDVTVVGLEIAK
ncbi:MAG: PP2C family protein-serine/threonine phosphatase [Phycisphaerae bacterium]|nr:PP2C family protein-serine/threonine phosphatase [Phycisphaerae bacterium]